MPKVLVLTAIDSSGSAGLTAAVEAIRSQGVEAFPVATALTGQRVINDRVEPRIEMPRERILEIIKLNEPYDLAFLGLSPISAEELGYRSVVDPAIKTSYGAPLAKLEDVKKTIRGAYVITPNASEAKLLAGSDDISYALEALSEYSERVIITGVEGKDLIRTPHGRIVEIKPRGIAVGYRDLRGSGTLYAATIAALIAKGYNVIDSAREAKRLVEISSALSVYNDSLKADMQVTLRSKAIEAESYKKLKEAIEELLAIKTLPKALPEVGSNFAYALPRAATEDDVFGISGRIVRSKRPLKANLVGEITLGGSGHIARAILAMMRYYPRLRACMNIKFSERVIEALKEMFVVSFYDRREEPEEIKRQEGKTTSRGISQAVERAKSLYGEKEIDIVYHRGDWGKEPMILVFGREPREVVEKIKKIIDLYDAPSRACTLSYAFLAPLDTQDALLRCAA